MVGRWILALVMPALALLAACGSASDGRPMAIDMGTEVLVRDLDRDGRPDIVALTHRLGDQPVRGHLRVLHQRSDGVFEQADSVDFGCYPWSMTAADIDGDGLDDLVIADVGSHGCSEPGSGNALYLLRQDRTRPGRLLPPQKLLANVYAYRAVIADLDGDGLPDIAFGDSRRGGHALRLLRQDPLQRGRFTAPVALDVGGSLSELAAGDVDGDGRADLFALLYAASSGYVPNNRLVLMLQNADGTLAPPRTLAAQSGLNPQRLAIADVDADGRADLLAHLTPFSTDYGALLRVLVQGPAPGTWSAPVDTGIAWMLGVDGTAFGDLDGDRRTDAVLAGSWPESGGPYAAPNIRSRVNVVRATGAGQWQHVAAIDVAPQPDAVAIGDLDGDGRADLVLHDGRTLWAMRQETPLGFTAPRALN